MFRILITLVALFGATPFTFAQNLCFNPDLEQFLNCPTQVGQIQNVSGFESAEPLDRSEYFNQCAVAPNASADVPMNFYGNANARSGDAYIGLQITFDQALGKRGEILSGTLTDTIFPGDMVTVSFYVWHAQRSQFFSDSMFVLLTREKRTQLNPYQGGRNAIISGHMDTLSWNKWSVTFMAEDTALFFIIGGGVSFPQSFNGAAALDMTYAYIDDFEITSTATSIYDPRRPRKERWEIVSKYTLLGQELVASEMPTIPHIVLYRSNLGNFRSKKMNVWSR